jgi:4a-hydroxytetrahydrobiopterin dehydratase
MIPCSEQTYIDRPHCSTGQREATPNHKSYHELVNQPKPERPDSISYAGTAMDKPKILTAKELRTIMPRLSGWKLVQNKLLRTFEFQDFVQSLSFVNSLVAYFETVDHHPDVRIAYGEVTFELTRYDLGGRVTDRDVEVAKKISSMYRARS